MPIVLVIPDSLTIPDSGTIVWDSHTFLKGNTYEEYGGNGKAVFSVHRELYK